MSDTPSINIGTITGGQNNIGKTEIAGDQVQNNHYGALPSVDQVFDAVAESLPEEVADEMKAGVIEPLQKLAALAPEEQKSEDVKEQAEPLYQRLVPYAPQITKGLLTFGEAALTSLASSNPIVAGLLAVCKTVKTLQPPATAPADAPPAPAASPTA